MRQDWTIQIKKIIKEIDCPKQFKCCKKGIRKLCKTKKIGIELFLVCLENNPKGCKNLTSLGSLYFCGCPLRYYIKNKLEK